MSEQVEGRRPVIEALRAGRVERILIAHGARETGALAEIVELASANGVRVERLPRPAIERRAQTPVHQGVLAEVASFTYRSWREGVAAARERGSEPLLLALDGVTDPHNAGALIRSAVAFGVDAVLLPSRRAVDVTPTVAKASAGAVEHVVVDRVGNLARTLASCREDGLWIVAATGEGEQDISDCSLLSEACVIVVGAEGAGVSRLVAERADARCRIPIRASIGSLNASVAGSICLWEAWRRRGVERS